MRTMMSLLMAGASLAIAPPAMADRYPLQHGLQVRDYAFDIALSEESDDIRVNETVEVSFLADGLKAIDLDLCNVVAASAKPDPLEPCEATERQNTDLGPGSGPVPGVGRGMTMISATAGGTPLRFTHIGNRLHLTLPQPSRKGGRLAIDLAYHGVPAAGLFIGKNKYGDRVFFSDSWPNRARNWLATVDHISAKATKTVTVTAPSHYQVISNGLETRVADLPGGLRATTWREAVPIPSWQFSLGVAPMTVTRFDQVRGVDFAAWLAPQNQAADLSQAEATSRAAFDFYSDYIGPYAFEKLAHVDATGGRGAMELATSIFYFGDFRAMAHEMAHQWFGNAVTEATWDDVWLSEGFATYFDLLFTEHSRGHDTFLTSLRRGRDGAVKYALAHPDSTVVHRDLARDSEVLGNAPQIYAGGAMVLRTLNGVLGDRVFRAGIRSYYARHVNGLATSDDLRLAMEDACRADSGCESENNDLTWFFDQWLRRGGVPQVQGTWRYDPTRKVLEVAFTQTQKQGLYRLPTELAVSLPGVAGERRFKLVIDAPNTKLAFRLDAAPQDVALDPDTWTPMLKADVTQAR